MNNGLVSIPPRTAILMAQKAGTAIGGFQPFQIPSDCSIVNFFIVGGGGGGGAGFSAAAGTNRGGGGGGACSGITRASVARILLPNVIYVRVGVGGAGAIAGGANATDGERTIVAMFPSASSLAIGNILLCSSAHSSDAGRGFSSTSATGGNGGTPANAYSEANGDWSELLTFSTTTSITGSAGGSSAANGGNVITAGIISAGAGGAGTDTANTTRSGGTITFTQGVSYSIAGGSSAGASGSDGFWSLTPFFSLGGAGGASNGTGAAGAGGAGGIGSGGGGGGGGVTGGNGGRGGDGICIITWA